MTVKPKGVSSGRSDVASQAAKNVIDSRRLFYFYHVARLGSFSTAETVLDIAQPAMSRQIQQLEAELGAQLLVRKGRGVSLTETGAIVYRRAEAILAGMEETHLEIDAALRAPGGKVSLAAPSFFIRTFMPPVVQRFWNSHPGAQLRVVEASTGLVSEMLAAGDIDVAVVLHEPNSPRIETERIVSEAMDLVVSRDHPFARRAKVERAELKSQPLCIAGNRHGSRILIEQYFQDAGLPMNVGMELDSMFLMIAAIRDLPIVGFIPHGDLEPEDGLVAVPLDPPITRNLYLARLQQHANPLVQPLVQEIHAAVRARDTGGKRKTPSRRTA
jgi:DNA-binding transcriptional LysR family regulator